MTSMKNPSEEHDAETIEEKRKLPKKKTQSKDRVLEQKLLQARKNENLLVPKARSKIILPKIPVPPQLLNMKSAPTPLFLPCLNVSTKTKKLLSDQEPNRKEKPRYLLKQAERIQLPETPKETVFLQKQRVKKEERCSAFFQPAINRNGYNQNLYFRAYTERQHIAKQRKKKLDEYATMRKRAFDEITTIDSDIQQFIDGIRKDIKKSSNDIMREMEQQRHTTRKQIMELRKMFSHDNKTMLNRFSRDR